VSARLAAAGLSPQALAIECDSAALDDDDVLASLAMLRSHGATVCVSGLSRSGACLTNLGLAPIDRVVIDRSLVGGPGKGQTVARHLVALCRELNLETVADGVETVDHLAVTKILGVGHARGFLFGRPVTVDDVSRSLSGWAAMQLPMQRSQAVAGQAVAGQAVTGQAVARLGDHRTYDA